MEILLIAAGFIAAFTLGRSSKKRPQIVSEGEVLEGLRAMFTKDIADLDARLADRRCGWSEGDSIRQARAMTERMLNKLPPRETPNG